MKTITPLGPVQTPAETFGESFDCGAVRGANHEREQPGRDRHGDGCGCVAVPRVLN